MTIEALRRPTAALPAFIFDSWADATHGAIFYGVARDTGIDFHRVSVDGSDDRSSARSIDRHRCWWIS